jgi:hypothetical protein
VYGEEKNYFALGRLEQPWQTKNLFYRHNKQNEPTKKETLSFVLFESSFNSQQGPPPSLGSLVVTVFINQTIKPVEGPALPFQ